MATVSLIPSPVSFHQTAMSSRSRVPLSSNPNAANSPMRPMAVAHPKPVKRSHASNQREELYGQPPPAKKQMISNPSTYRVTARSPVKARTTTHTITQSRAVGGHRDRDTASHHHVKAQLADEDVNDFKKWAAAQKQQFVKHVFYFDNLPQEVLPKIERQIAALGAREDKFFSISISHVVTTRPIPQPQTSQKPKLDVSTKTDREEQEPQTINPSLLSRNLDSNCTKRKLFDTHPAGRRPPIQLGEDVVRRPKAPRQQNDILGRALTMGKKIWSLEKMQRILDMLTESDPYRAATLGQGGRTTKTVEQSNPLQMLNKERVSGPSDRDPTTSTKEMHVFKGPFIYIYDIEQKQRPIMAREYAKVADKMKGDWPQFRASGSGRCPFVEDHDQEKHSKKEREVARQAAVNAAVGSAPKLQPPTQISRPKPITGKRPLAEMSEVSTNRILFPSKTTTSGNALVDSAQGTKLSKEDALSNAFISANRSRPARIFAGEPVASGLQASNITSAIRSQMISSTTGTIAGNKSGVSKEVLGLQRKVLAKSGSVSQDPSSRRHAEMSVDSGPLSRSTSLGNPRLIFEGEETQHRRTHSVPSKLQPKPKKRDPKPGYCENCQDKFADFEEHIQSRTHRKFAENDENWEDLDRLLQQLERQPLPHHHLYSDETVEQNYDQY
ncbi:hypothetical protein PspLS_03717 [Pyricularia sp. CBS 133598]|nr:hypothetical protein PspLS_03717 [Pyricularia sp. CBS 133598]